VLAVTFNRHRIIKEISTLDIETIRNICKRLPSVTEGIKWGNDLCFMVGDKLFCVVIFDTPIQVSLKVRDEEFDEISNLDGIRPAPYVARPKWILVDNVRVFNKKKWEDYITQSYSLVKAKLSKKKIAQLK
jgi:predicted DNA-binding protein (MmcQ/YjbR family)